MLKAINLIAPLLTLLVVYGSLASSSPIDIVEIDQADKGYHATAYFILFFAWYLYFQNRYLRLQQVYFKYVLKDLFHWEWSIVIGTFVLCTVIGGILELAQGFLVKNRSMDVLDLIANTVGILFATTTLKIFSFLFLSREKK